MQPLRDSYDCCMGTQLANVGVPLQLHQLRLLNVLPDPLWLRPIESWLYFKC